MAPPNPRAYFQRYPTLFAPFYGDDERATISQDGRAQSRVVPRAEPRGRPSGDPASMRGDPAAGRLPLGPRPARPDRGVLRTHRTRRRRYGQTRGGARALWSTRFSRKTRATRWPDADLWIAPGQFAFPVEISAERIYGRTPAGVLGDVSDDAGGEHAGAGREPPWADEIDVKILRSGSFRLSGRDVGLREATFFHRPTGVMVVTDCIARIPEEIPPLVDPEKLLLVGKRSTAEPTPAVGSPGATPPRLDSPAGRR